MNNITSINLNTTADKVDALAAKPVSEKTLSHLLSAFIATQCDHVLMFRKTLIFKQPSEGNLQS